MLASELIGDVLTVFEIDETTGQRMSVDSLTILPQQTDPPGRQVLASSFWITGNDDWVVIDQRCIPGPQFVRIFDRRNGALSELVGQNMLGWDLIGGDIVATGSRYKMQYLYDVRTRAYERALPEIEGRGAPDDISSDRCWAWWGTSHRDGCGDD